MTKRIPGGRFGVAAAFLLSHVLSLPAQTVINEVLFLRDTVRTEPLRTHQWVEIVNKGADAVDLTGWSLSGRDGAAGASARALPSVTLPAGAFLTIHFTTGQNQLDFPAGAGDYYTGDDPDSPVWNWQTDEVALYSGSGIVDFVAWTTAGTPYRPGAAAADAVAAKIWTDGESLDAAYVSSDVAARGRRVFPGESIGRDALSSDTNSLADFDAHGGVHAMDISPGRQNVHTSPTFDSLDQPAPPQQLLRPRAAAGKAKWTVLVYLGADNSLAPQSQRDIDDIARAGGSSADVNFVVLWDILDGGTTHRMARGRIGPLGRPNLPSLFPADNQDHATFLEGTQIPHLNMGDPATLSSFLQWGEQNYAAEKYVLILWSHGLGWKGVVYDDGAAGKRAKSDRLTMGELGQAVAGHSLELLVFDACLMSSVEVAFQVSFSARYMIASEEITTGNVAYEAFTASLLSAPDQDALTLGRRTVEDAAARYAGWGASRWDVSLVDLSAIAPLVRLIDQWSRELKNGVPVLNQRDDPTDNVQNRLRLDRLAAERFNDDNFVDLGQFAKKVDDDAQIPKCAKGAAQSVRDQLKKAAVLLKHGPGMSDVEGLHIHFPRYRAFRPPPGSVPNPFPSTPTTMEPYDAPNTRLTDADSMLAGYAPNVDLLPYKSADPEAIKPGDADVQLAAPKEWPRIPTPRFSFVLQTRWHEFLNRYYHPVADNHILGTKLPPGTGCEVPIDEVEVPVDTDVQFSGAGSSDADMPSTVTPLYYFWDTDSTKDCRDQHPVCKAPSAVGPFHDPATESNDIKDEDQYNQNSLIDDQDAAGLKVTMKCTKPGAVLVTLHVFDDNHTFNLHDTYPDSPYTHPQTDSQIAVVKCTQAPFWTIRIPGTFYMGYVFSFSATLMDPFGFPVTGVPVTVSGTAGASVAPRAVSSRAAAGPLQLTTDSSGSIRFDVNPGSPGGQSITLSAPGVPDRTVTFSVLQPSTPGGSQLNVSAPASVAANRPATLRVTVTDQPGPVSQATFVALTNNVRFIDGTLFGSGTGSQVFTDSDGNASVTFMAIGGTAATIGIYSGTAYRSVSIPVTGGAPIPDSLTLTGVPALVRAGDPLAIGVTVRSGGQPVAGAQVAFTVTLGGVLIDGAPAGAKQVVLTTDANGVASFRGSASLAGSAGLSLAVNGTALTRSLSFVVAPR